MNCYLNQEAGCEDYLIKGYKLRIPSVLARCVEISFGKLIFGQIGLEPFQLWRVEGTEEIFGIIARHFYNTNH